MLNDIQNNSVSHAYLFDGPEKLGKTLVARTFAQILQCRHNFCRICSTCKQVEKGQHIDTMELLDDGQAIKVDKVRELMSLLATTSSSRHKIVFIKNINRMGTAAANALLKSLEEPIPGVVFILTSTQSHALLDTIISRCRVIPFHPHAETLIADHLKASSPDMDEEMIHMMAGFSMGRSGRAMEFLNDPDYFRFYQDMYQQITHLLDRSTTTERMMYAATVAEDDEHRTAFFELFSHILRGLILEKIKGHEVPYRFDQLFDMVESLNQARFEVDHNVNARVALEKLMMNV